MTKIITTTTAIKALWPGIAGNWLRQGRGDPLTTIANLMAGWGWDHDKAASEMCRICAPGIFKDLEHYKHQSKQRLNNSPM